MAKDVRNRMVRSAVRLLAEKGLQATSFSEVLEQADAPRGSVYHHFPGGKEQLVASALELAGYRSIELLDDKAGASPHEITAFFLEMWRHILDRSDFKAGCAVLAVTVATDSPELTSQAADIFRTWRARLAELFQQGGLSKRDALQFAATLVASSEGAVVMSRAEQTMEPFDLVCAQLLDQVQRMTEGKATAGRKVGGGRSRG